MQAAITCITIPLIFPVREPNMTEHKATDASKKVKTIAAIIYLLVLGFLVGGSYLNQQLHAQETTPDKTVAQQ
jgi:hypothetical protein